MSAYKKLKKEDSFITTYTAHKSFSIDETQHTEYGVETYVGISGSSTFFPSTGIKRLQGTNYEHYQELVYSSIKHLYYSGFDEYGEPVTSSMDISGSAFDNFLQSSYTSQQRRLFDRATIISIPVDKIGTGIKPGSVLLRPSNTETADSYISGSYVTDDYEEEGDEAYGGDSTFTGGITDSKQFIGSYYNSTDAEFISDSVSPSSTWSTTLMDDGNGNLILSGSSVGTQQRRIVGNIIYSHGLIVITTPTVANYYANYFSGSLSWQSTLPIYTHNYHCTIKESEFNFTQHPSAVTGSNGDLADNITGSMFQPYFTAVGLYNDTNELIAVGKMAQPVPVSDNTEMTVVVKLDM